MNAFDECFILVFSIGSNCFGDGSGVEKVEVGGFGIQNDVLLDKQGFTGG